MESDWSVKAFKIVVSYNKANKLGLGRTAQKTARSLYYYAERNSEGSISIQPLSAKYCPCGDKIPVDMVDFLKNYRPEPLFYYNRVKPVVDGLEADLEKGEGYLAAGRLDLGEKCFKRALETDQENVRGLFGLGTAYLDAGKQEEAEAILGRIMTLDMAFHPDHIHLFNAFGIRMRKAGMHREALVYYTKAAALNRQDENLHFNTCRIHYEMNDLDQAFECVVLALGINPDFAEGVQMMDHLLRKKPELKSRLSRKPDDPGQPREDRREGLDLKDALWEQH